MQPNVEAFEFSLPRHSRSEQYAVWISYTISVYGPDGDLRTRWPVKAYGEVDARRFKGNLTMQKATVLAMRDAATIVIDSLHRDTGFRRAVMGQTKPAEADDEPANLLSEEGATEKTIEVGNAADEPLPELNGKEWNGES